jgi:hypothetical protein
MSRFILLNIATATKQGFPFVLQVSGHNRCSGILVELYRLKKNSEDHAVQSHAGATRKLIPIDQLQCETQVIDAQFRDYHHWFTTRDNELEEIRREILMEKQSQEELHLVIETPDLWIKRLPWYEWDILANTLEFSILLPSTQPNFSSPAIASRIASRHKMRILAVFGNSIGIDTSPDEAAIRALPNVEAQFLHHPDAKTLSDQLRDEPGWDILFFAGHSSSSKDGTTGTIDLNLEYSLTLADLKKALRKSIEQGLQLAIFNSCDGLGLANQLADLNIPQVIVMRESIPDRAAQIFAGIFLKEFSGGQSVSRSVRLAREQLQQYGMLKSGVQISGLPTICQAAIQTEVIWRQNPRVDYIPPDIQEPLWKAITVISAQKVAINAIALAHGKIISASSGAKIVQVWQYPSGDFHHTLTGSTQVILAIAVHPLNSTIAIALDRTIKFWDIITEQIKPSKLNYRGKIYTPSAIAISSDGKRLASGHPVSGKIKLWDLETGQLIRKLSGHFWGTQSLIATHPFLVSSTIEYPVKFWDWHSEKPVHVINGLSGVLKPLRNWFRRDAGPRCIAVSPNKQLLATGNSDECIQLWDLETGTVRQHLGSHNEVQTIAFSPDGHTLATGGDRTVQLWNVQTGKREATLAHSGAVTCLVFDSDSQKLVVGSRDGNIIIWQKRSTLQELE